jgi:hypothetical protein
MRKDQAKCRVGEVGHANPVIGEERGLFKCWRGETLVCELEGDKLEVLKFVTATYPDEAIRVEQTGVPPRILRMRSPKLAHRI